MLLCYYAITHHAVCQGFRGVFAIFVKLRSYYYTFPRKKQKTSLNHPSDFLERGFAAQGRQHADLLER